MSEQGDPEYVDVSGKFTKKAWIRLIGFGALTIIIGVASFSSIVSVLGTSGNFLGGAVSRTLHKNPIKDPIVVGAAVTNNPFIRYDEHRRSGTITQCSYEFSYSYLGKDYTGFAKDAVDTNRDDYKFYGCTPTGSSFSIYVSKNNPTKVWIKPSITYNDKFMGLVLLVVLGSIPNWILVKLYQIFGLRRKEE